MRATHSAGAILEKISVSQPFREWNFRRTLISHSDDLTVEVIFFGNAPKNGNVTMNQDATAAIDVKPKL